MDFFTSYASNIVATTMCHPIDVVKTNVQTSNLTIANAIKKVVRDRSFFRGLGSNLGTYPIFWGVYFETKQTIRKYNIDESKMMNNFLVSYGAGGIASFIANPLFVMKVQMQTSTQGYLQTLRTMGIRGLYTGFAATSLNNAKLGLQFPLYDWIRDSGYGVGVSAFIAKGIATSILYPFDLVRVQQRKSLDKDTIKQILKRIYGREGIRGLYRGVLLYNCISTPHFVIMMYGVDFLKQFNE